MFRAHRPDLHQKTNVVVANILQQWQLQKQRLVLARLPPLLRLLLLDDANKPSRVSGSGEFADSWTEVQMAAESGHTSAQMWYAGKSRLGQERTRKQCLFVMYIGGLPVSATAAVISVVCCFAAITLACNCMLLLLFLFSSGTGDIP